jgi:hypothetical protein
VTATFKDGSQETRNLLIGIEGAYSRVHEYLLGKEWTTLILSCIVALAIVSRLLEQEINALRNLHPRYCIVFYSDRYFIWLGSK